MTEQKEEDEAMAMEEDWREVTEKMAVEREQYQYMQEHDILTDCTFVVGPKDGETREFKAHRLHIARVSPVFEAMLLRSEMVEAKTGHVRVTDLSPNTFQKLLNSIYGKEPEIKFFHEAQDLTFAAHKYQMKTLLKKAVTLMIAQITPENIWTAFETADLLQEARLKETCVSVLQYQTMRCITNPRILQASEENVALLLEQDELNVGDEFLLVNVIVHWARHAARQRGLSEGDSGVRAVLEPRLLKLFRFLAMSHQQFMLAPGLSSWLTEDEISAISECLQFRDFKDLPQNFSRALTRKNKNVTVIACPVQSKFKKVEGMLICARKIQCSAIQVCQSYKECCVRGKSTGPDPPQYYNCVHATLIFRVMSNCQWLGFQCASQYRNDPTLLSAKHPLYMEQIVAFACTFNHSLSTEFKRIEISKTKYLQETEYNSTISILFDKSIPLVPDNWFTVDIIYFRTPTDDKPDKMHYQKPASRHYESTESGIEFIFYPGQKGYYCPRNDGLIEGIIFSV